MIKFNATLLAATALAQSVDETRYYLNGVYFDGLCAVATDGHMLTIAHDPVSQVDENGIYPISKKAISAMSKFENSTVTIDDNLLFVRNFCNENVYVESCIEIDGTYPDYHRVMPDERGSATLALFKWIDIKRICETKKIIGGVVFRITGENDNAPHIVSYGISHNIFSVIMPCRGDDHYSALPDWYVRQDTAKVNQPEAAA